MGWYVIFFSFLALPGLARATNANLCALLIAGHAQADRYAHAIVYLRDTVGKASGIDGAHFFSLFPENEIFERALAALIESGQVTKDSLAAGEPLPRTALEEALGTRLAELASAFHGGPPAGPWRPGLARIERKSETIENVLRKGFRSTRYGDLLRIVEHALENELPKSCDRLGVDPDLLPRFLPRERVEDLILADLFVRVPMGEDLFLAEEGFGERLVKEIGLELALVIQRGGTNLPELEPTLAPPEASVTYRKLAAAGRAAAPDVPLVSKAVWERAVSEVEVHLVSLCGRAAIASHRVLDYDEPGFGAADLAREIFYEMLQWRVRGRALQGATASRVIASRAAAGFLERRGIPTASTPEKAGPPLAPTDSGVPVSDRSVFFSSWSGADTLRAREAVKSLVDRLAPTYSLEAAAVLPSVWETLDLELALQWARKRKTPAYENVSASLEKLVSHILKRLKRRAYEGRARWARLNANPRLRRWRLMALHVPRAVRNLAGRYGLSEKTFWGRYSEADAIEAVGLEAARWKEEGYALEPLHREAVYVAERAVRGLLKRLALEAGIGEDREWRDRLRARRADTYSVVARLDAEKTARALALWSLSESEKDWAAAFRAIYLEGQPPWAYARRETPGEKDLPINPRAKAGFDRFMTLYSIVSRCYRLLRADRISEWGPLVYRAERRGRELSLLYLSRGVSLDMAAVMERTEAAMAAREELPPPSDPKWDEAIDAAIRLEIDSRARTAGETVSPAVLHRKEAGPAVIPSELIVRPEGMDASDQAWKNMMIRLPAVVDSETKRYGLSPTDFWKSTGGRYEAGDVREAIIAEFAWWREQGFRGYEKLFEETEVLRRSVRKLCARRFHELKLPFPEDAVRRIAAHELDRVDAIAMIPDEEFRVVYAVWKAGFGIVWKDKPEDRIRLFEDLFLHDVPKASIPARNPSFTQDHEIFNRRTRYYESFMAVRAEYHDPSKRILFALPPDPCPYAPRVWRLVQQELLIDPEKSRPFLIEERYDREELGRILTEEIERFPKRSDSDDTQRRHAAKIAESVRARLRGVPLDAARPPRPRRSVADSAGEKPDGRLPLVVLPPPDVVSEIGPELPVGARPVEGREAATTRVLSDPDEQGDDEEDADDDRPLGWVEEGNDEDDDEEDADVLSGAALPEAAAIEVPELEPPPLPQDGPKIDDSAMRDRLRARRETELMADPRDVAMEILPLYGLMPLHFWKSMRGPFTQEDVVARIRVEAEAWRRNGYGDISSVTEVFQIRERALRFLARQLVQENRAPFPENWARLLETHKTDRTALVGRIPEAQLEATLLAWERSGEKPELLHHFRLAYLEQAPFDRLLLSSNPTDDEWDRLYEADDRTALAFDELMKRWQEAPEMRPADEGDA